MRDKNKISNQKNDSTAEKVGAKKEIMNVGLSQSKKFIKQQTQNWR